MMPPADQHIAERAEFVALAPQPMTGGEDQL
jgi:hypothetical protein